MKTTIVCKFSPGKNLSAFMSKHGQAWYKGIDVAAALGYNNPKTIVNKKVKENEKCVKKERTGSGHHKYELVTYINESGLYRLIFSLKLEVAEQFKTWVFSVVFPNLKKANSLNRQIFFNESDLHFTIVKYIKLHYPEVKLIPGLGEYQRTISLRCNAWSKGYTGGQPDLLIPLMTLKHNGLAIELKNPNGKGKVTLNQSLWHKSLSDQGFLVIVGHNYKKITKIIKKYLDETAMSCQVHRKFYKSPKCLANHLSIFHSK